MREEIKIKLLENLLEEVTKEYDYFISLQNKKIQQTFEMAVKDPLTKLYNRQYLNEYAKKAFNKLQREESVLILIFIDLDNFKYVNDSFGHKEGDKVLQQVAEILQNTFNIHEITYEYINVSFDAITLIKCNNISKNECIEVVEKLRKIENEIVRKLNITNFKALIPDCKNKLIYVLDNDNTITQTINIKNICEKEFEEFCQLNKKWNDCETKLILEINSKIK